MFAIESARNSDFVMLMENSTAKCVDIWLMAYFSVHSEMCWYFL